ncbi:MAG: hypothetical protein U1F66_01445 [bacterium]
MRQADGGEVGATRGIPRLQRLSRVQEHQRGAARGRGLQGRRGEDHRRGLREVRRADGLQAGPLRAIPRL